MHYVLVGGMVFPLIAGFYYWLPHVSGRMPSETLGRWGFWLFFIGFNMTFLIMHLTGLFGMPRRVYTYEAGLGWEWFNLISSIGGFITALGVAVIIVDVGLHFRFGRKAEQNPWNADSLEWAVEMPVTTYNFASLPEIKSRHPLWENPDLPHTIATGQHGLPEIGHGRREIYGSDAVSGQVKDVIHLPSNSWIPLQAASMIAVVCLGLLTKYYWVALAGTLLALVFLIRWSWHNGAHPVAAPKTEDWERTDPPLHSRTFNGPGLWGVLVAMIANGTLFSSLIFGWFYLWTSAPLWDTPADGPLSLVALTGSGVLLTLAAGLFAWAVSRLRKGDDSLLEPVLWVVSALGAAHFGWLLWEAIAAPLTPTTLAHDSVLSLMLWYLLLQSGLATLASVLQALRVRVGYVDASLPYEPAVVLPLWAYATGAFWISFAAFILLPMTWSGA